MIIFMSCYFFNCREIKSIVDKRLKICYYRRSNSKHSKCINSENSRKIRKRYKRKYIICYLKQG